MKRVCVPSRVAPAFVVLAALTLGCGGSVGGLLATVPPPVELTTGATGGLAQLPKAATYRGELRVEHVAMAQGENGAWTETGSELLSTERAEAEIGRAGTIELRRDGAPENLFAGTLKAVSAASGRDAATYALLKAFDGRRERFDYTLLSGSPETFALVARTAVKQTVGRAEFDRYRFSLRPQ